MKVVAVCTRLEEDLRRYAPYITERMGVRFILIDADVDGFKQISLEEAAEIIGEDVIERTKTIKNLNLWWEDRICV